jgi:hypothetical protein
MNALFVTRASSAATGKGSRDHKHERRAIPVARRQFSIRICQPYWIAIVTFLGAAPHFQLK